jgi:hypothetical protein
LLAIIYSFVRATTITKTSQYDHATMLLQSHLSLKEPLCASPAIQLDAPLQSQHLQHAWPALYVLPSTNTQRSESADMLEF